MMSYSKSNLTKEDLTPDFLEWYLKNLSRRATQNLEGYKKYESHQFFGFECGSIFRKREIIYDLLKGKLYGR